MVSVATRMDPFLPSFSTDDARWEAVRRRDRAADGVFYYSVLTTGVYCRPSCASRLARRDNVAFHATCEAAEAAGFRPCKRCRPNEASVAERHASAVANACRVIEEAEEPPDLDALARTAGMSRFYFHRVFKAVTGVTPKAYADAHRAERVRDELAQGATVTEAIYGAGFNSSGRFYAASPDLLGMTPTEFRSGGNGASIRFAVGECSLGSILVAATDKGVCAILLGDDPDTLVRDLQDRFPRARLIGSWQRSSAWSRRRPRASICRSTCAGPHSSSASGRRCAGFRADRPRAMPRSPSALASPRRCVRSLRPAQRTRSRWRSRAIA